MSALSELDEFFARKDRRRNKKCNAMLSTPEDVARKLGNNIHTKKKQVVFPVNSK